MPNKPPRKSLSELVITISTLLFGAIILFLSIDAMHMRPDEYLTFDNMRGGFAAEMTRLATRNNQAPLWWINSWAWQHGIGMEEFVGRYNSLLISMLTLAVVYQLGKTWFGQPHYGQFAVIVLAVNSYFVTYALEMRMYALGMFAAVLSMRLFWAWLQRRTLLRALAYGLSTAVLLYIHYYLVFLIIIQAIYFLIFHSRSLRLVAQGIVAGLIGVLAWVPGGLILVGQLTFIDFAASGGLNNPTQPTTLDTLSELFLIATSGQFVLYTLLCALSLLVAWQRRAYWLLVSWLLLAPAIVLALNTQVALYNARYVSFIVPAIGLMIGVGLASLPQRWRWAALGLVCTLSLMTFQEQLEQRTPFRHILTDVSHIAQADDVVFAYQHGEEGYVVDQLERYLRADVLANRVASVDEARTARRVWFLTETWHNDEVQRAFAELEASHRLTHVGGACSSDWCYLAQLLLAPPLREPVTFGDEIEFFGADVVQDTANLTALLWWGAAVPPTQDYSISLQLVDEAGTLVAQQDGPIIMLDAATEIQTSQLVPGNSYIDERNLPLSSLASGRYTLRVVVYQWQDGTRLTTTQGSDHSAIETVIIRTE